MFNSLRPRPSAPSSTSSSSPTAATGTGVQHPLLGGSLSRRESLTRENSTDKDGVEGRTTKVSGDATASTQTTSGTNVPLPYKPRQRHSHSGSVPTITPSLAPAPTTASPTVPGNTRDLAATSATTSLTASYTHAAASPTGVKGSVTSRLQLQQLKAAAQRAGIASAPPPTHTSTGQTGKAVEGGAMGMQMLETAFEKVSRRGEGKTGTSREWGVVVNAMTTGKVSLSSG